MPTPSEIVNSLLEAEPGDIDADVEHYIDAISLDDEYGKLTFQKAVTLNHFYHRWKRHKIKGKETGASLEVRRNGKTKTWKTRPGEFRIPVKYGLYEYFYIDNRNADEWSTVPLPLGWEKQKAKKERAIEMQRLLHAPVKPIPPENPTPKDPNQLDLFNENGTRLRNFGLSRPLAA
jgi:hypothetical protein